MTDSMRDQIARVIDKALDGDCGYGVGEHLADVLLARWPVLAGVTDETVENGARALADWDGADWDLPEPEFDASEVITKRAYRVGAAAALTAVFGQRDAAVPGAGSTR